MIFEHMHANLRGYIYRHGIHREATPLFYWVSLSSFNSDIIYTPENF